MPSAILHRDLRTTPPLVERGEGAYLFDTTGKRYLDASGGAAVSCLGHSHPRVIAAIEAQLRRMPFSHTSFFTNQPAEDLAALLIDRAPAGFGAGRVAFLGSGSEAMEAALKLARQHFWEKGEPKRARFIARRMSYHGNTLGALAIGGHAGRRAPYAPMLMDVAHVSPCFAYRFQAPGESDDAYATRLADELAVEIERQGPETVAAFIAEPVVGATIGCVPPVPGYFRRIREVCDRYGVLLIADEVMCGMGRTGSLFAIAQEDVCPDIITIAKGLGAGYQPIGALLASETVIAPLAAGSGTLQHGHTYMSHAIACAGSLAVMRALEEEQLLGAVQQRGRDLEAALRARFGDHPHVGDIRGRGLFWAMELVADRATKAPFPKSLGLAAQIKRVALANGLICYPSGGTADGENGDHVLLAPPFILSAPQIDEIVDKLDVSLKQALGARPLAA
ncbi:aspartate aminotransferase family protein [Humitalea sp. 24SJ18S-53]|uniref:aspartate aminotransferase family protein n=1 Tax=Humitalea sp. 24SJ18S-53 TaxID=3422307 RepID=UPI003D665F7F